MRLASAASILAFLLVLLPPGCSPSGAPGQVGEVRSPGGDRGLPAPTRRVGFAAVVLVDTLRADVLDEVPTPRIDAFSHRGLVVRRAWAASTWTVPSVISLFTGAFPRTHGWDLPVGQRETRPVPALPLLAEVLHRAGVHTEGYYANAYLAPELGFGRGFDAWRRSSDDRIPGQVRRRVEQWLREDAALPEPPRRFLYVHFIGPHSALHPSPEARRHWGLDDHWFEEGRGFLIGRAKRGREPGVREAYARAYHAVVEDVDRRFGELLDALGPYAERGLVVLLADHGEELGERGGVFGHGWSVAESLTHVPLVAVGAGLPREERGTASLVEVADLVCRALGVEHRWPAELPWTGPLVAQRHGKEAVLVDGRWKGERFQGEWTVYDLQADPAGLQPLSGPGAEKVRERVREAWAEWERRVPALSEEEHRVELSPGTLRELEALGYVEGG